MRRRWMMMMMMIMMMMMMMMMMGVSTSGRCWIIKMMMMMMMMMMMDDDDDDFYFQHSYSILMCGLLGVSASGGAGSSEEAQQLIGTIGQQVQELEKRWSDLNHTSILWQGRLDEVVEVGDLRQRT
jgi:hypothetical protein